MTTLNIINTETAQADLDRLLKGPASDDRVAKWMKKTAKTWLLQRQDCIIPIVPGSPLEADMPEWAQRIRADGSGDSRRVPTSPRNSASGRIDGAFIGRAKTRLSRFYGMDLGRNKPKISLLAAELDAMEAATAMVRAIETGAIFDHPVGVDAEADVTAAM